MRTKKMILNTIFSLIEEIVAVICAFILPKLILKYFGSQYNGLTTSITQFLSCAVLLRSGIGGATRAVLYKPLAEKNQAEFDSIVKATDLFMKRVGIILLAIIVLFSLIYPAFVSSEFDWFFTFSLFLIIGISTFAESFFRSNIFNYITGRPKIMDFIINKIFKLYFKCHYCISIDNK